MTYLHIFYFGLAIFAIKYTLKYYISRTAYPAIVFFLPLNRADGIVAIALSFADF